MPLFDQNNSKTQNRTGYIIAKTHNTTEANDILGHNFLTKQDLEIEEERKVYYLIKFSYLSFTSSLWAPVDYFYTTPTTRPMLSTYSATLHTEYKTLPLTSTFNKDKLKIDTILSVTKTTKGVIYKIKWVDCSVEDATWEPEHDLKLIKSYNTHLCIYNNYNFYISKLERVENKLNAKEKGRNNGKIKLNDKNNLDGCTYHENDIIGLLENSNHADFVLSHKEIYSLIKRLAYSKLSYDKILLSDFPIHIKRLLVAFIIYTDHTPKLLNKYNTTNNNKKEQYNTLLQYNFIFCDLIQINKWRKQLNNLKIRNISITSTKNKLGLSDELQRIICYNQTNYKYIETIIVNSSLIKQKNKKQIIGTLEDLNIGIVIYDTFNTLLIQSTRTLTCNLRIFIYDNFDLVLNSKYYNAAYLKQYTITKRKEDWGSAGKEGLIDFETNNQDMLKVTYTATFNKEAITTPSIFKIELTRRKQPDENSTISLLKKDNDGYKINTIIQLLNTKFVQKKCLLVYNDIDLKTEFIQYLQESNKTTTINIKEIMSFNKTSYINIIKEYSKDSKNSLLLVKTDVLNHSTSSIVLSKFDAIIYIHLFPKFEIDSLLVPLIGNTAVYIPCYSDGYENNILTGNNAKPKYKKEQQDTVTNNNANNNIINGRNNNEATIVLYKKGMELSVNEDNCDNIIYKRDNCSNVKDGGKNFMKLYNFTMTADRFVGFLDVNFKNTNLNPFNIRRKLYVLLSYYSVYNNDEFIAFIERDRNDMLRTLRKMNVDKKVFDIFMRMKSGKDTRSYYEYYFIYHNLAFIVLLYKYYDMT